MRTWLPVESAGAAGKWDDVTLLDCLDMTTGNYYSSNYQEDEDRHTGAFFAAETFAGKIDASFSWPAREPPGQRHIYHTTDTFILGASMQRILQAQSPHAEGGDHITDIWHLLVDSIFKPLQLSSSAFSSLRTYDDAQQPYSGYGLFFKRDDLARLCHWILNGGGALPTTASRANQSLPQIRQRRQVVLDPTALNAALQREPLNRGLNPNHPSLDLRYNYGFWAQLFQGSSFGCPSGVEHYYQPYLSGYGGIRVVMMGNGIVYSYVSDNGEFPSMADAIQESRKFGALC